MPDKSLYKYFVGYCSDDKWLCKSCHLRIEQNTVLIKTKAQEIEGEDGYTNLAYHLDCFFMIKKFVLGSTSELYGYECLSTVHRQCIAKKVGTSENNKMDVQLRSINNLKLHFGTQIQCVHCSLTVASTQVILEGDMMSTTLCSVIRVHYHMNCYLQNYLLWEKQLRGVLSLSDKKVVLQVIKSQMRAVAGCHGDESLQSVFDNLQEEVKKLDEVNEQFNWPPKKSNISLRHQSIQSTAGSSVCNKSKTFKPNITTAKRITPPPAPVNKKKIELKKSDLKNEIEKILTSHDHSTITSKIVRNMLMVKFSVDLGPHKKFIDTTIMDIVSQGIPKKLQVRSLEGTYNVDEPETSKQHQSPGVYPVSPDVPISCDLPQTTPISPPTDIDTISPMDILANGYDSTSTETPINICACCLCPFRVHAIHELPSLSRHITEKHKNDKSCVVCLMDFDDVFRLMLHVAKYHRNLNAFTCKQCGQKFDYHNRLSKHAAVCFAFEDISDIEEESDSGTRSPERKRSKFAGYDDKLPDVVNDTDRTLSRIQDFLDAKL